MSTPLEDGESCEGGRKGNSPKWQSLSPVLLLGLH